MKLILTCIVLSVYLTSALAGPTKGQLVWSDEFDGNRLNETNWNNITNKQFYNYINLSKISKK